MEPDEKLRPVPPCWVESTPLVILAASRFGICVVLNAPVVIFEASRFGICAVVKVPVVILEASRLGTCAAGNVPALILSALRLAMLASVIVFAAILTPKPAEPPVMDPSATVGENVVTAVILPWASMVNCGIAVALP